MANETVKIKYWLTTGYIGGDQEGWVEVDKEEWDSLDDENKDAYVKEYAFATIEWGYEVEDEG